MNRILYRLANNLNIYIDKQADNLQLMKQLNEVKDQLLPYIKEIIYKRLQQVPVQDTEYFKNIVIKNKFFKIEQLDRWLIQHKSDIICRILQIAFINASDYSSIYSKFNINEKDDNTLLHWIVNNIDEEWYINTLIQELNKIQDDLLIKFFGPAKDFSKFRDQVGSEVYSTENYKKMINDNKTVVIFNNKIVDIDTYRKSTSKFKRVTFGSVVNNVLIIYHTNYSINILKRFLKEKGNYAKVYILQPDKHLAFRSDNNLDKYIRLAKKIY